MNGSNILMWSLKRAVKLREKDLAGLSHNCRALFCEISCIKSPPFFFLLENRKKKSLNSNAITFYIILSFKRLCKTKKDY